MSKFYIFDNSYAMTIPEKNFEDVLFERFGKLYFENKIWLPHPFCTPVIGGLPTG